MLPGWIRCSRQRRLHQKKPVPVIAVHVWQARRELPVQWGQGESLDRRAVRENVGKLARRELPVRRVRRESRVRRGREENQEYAVRWGRLVIRKTVSLRHFWIRI